MAQNFVNVNVSKRVRITNCFDWPRIVATVQIQLDISTKISDQQILHVIAINITEEWQA